MEFRHGGSENIAAPFQFNSFLNAFFLQDDWKVKPNLTISTGIRFEHETPVNESQNRMVNGFNPTAVNEATAAARTNYAAHPSSLLPAASFQPTGGALYASSSNRRPTTTRRSMSVRASAFAGRPKPSMRRASSASATASTPTRYNDYNQGQSYGYSQCTAYVQTDNTGLPTTL